jgi:hypothetical protein
MSVLLTNPATRHLPHALLVAIQEVYTPAGLKVTTPAMRETESAEYGACRLGIDGRLVVFRVAKTTPTKVGQFVTLWKRPTPNAIIAPLDSADGVALVVVNVGEGSHRGQFVFPHMVLVEKGILSLAQKGGKRAFRVYPPWCQTLVRAAVLTQKWQAQYFLPLPLDERVGSARVRHLFA